MPSLFVNNSSHSYLVNILVKSIIYRIIVRRPSQDFDNYSLLKKYIETLCGLLNSKLFVQEYI